MHVLNSVRLKSHLLLWNEWFRSERPVFQLCCAGVLIGHLLSYIPFLYSAFSLTPNSIFLFHLWKPVTAIFMEINPILIAWSILALHQLIHMIEPVWTLSEVVKFAAITQFLSSLLVSLLGLMSFALFQSLNFFYYANMNGLVALSAAALISIKQFLPDTVLFTTSKGRLKNTHLPLTSLFILLVLSLFGIVRFVSVIQCAVGIQVSWTYLRFIQRNKINNCKGDDSEHFAWTTCSATSGLINITGDFRIFPRIIRPLTNRIGNISYYILVNLKVLRKVENVVLPIIEQATIELDADSAADIKRHLALRELQTRLAQQKQRSSHQSGVKTPQTRAVSLEPVLERGETSSNMSSPQQEITN